MEQSIYRISLEIQASHAQAALDMKRGDTGRRIFISLTDGGNPYPIGEDCYAVFTARKPDENPIFNPCAVVGDTIVYDVTPQTTAAPGRLDCEIKLYGKDDRLITSPAFTLTVHEAVFNQGDAPASQPELDALTHLVSQTNTLLTQVRQDLESGAFQGEKGEKGEKGPQGEKGEKGDCAIDDARVGSAPWSARNLVDRLCPGISQTGPGVVCRPMAGYPLEVVSHIQSAQSGSGDPSPDNIRPITGQTAIRMWRGGKNLFDGHWEPGYIIIEGADKGKDVANSNAIRTGFIPIIPGQNYFITLPKGNWYPVLLDKNKENGRYAGLRKSSFPITANDDECYLRLANLGDTEIPSQVQIELGSAATEYEPYRGTEFTLELGQTVYGGTFNWAAGELTVTHQSITVDGSGNFISGASSYNKAASTNRYLTVPATGSRPGGGSVAFCDRLLFFTGTTGIWSSDDPVHRNTFQLNANQLHINLANSLLGVGSDAPNEERTTAFDAYFRENPTHFVIPLADPITVSLTPREVAALPGDNVLWSDSGNTTVSGKADLTQVIQTLTNAILALGGNI